MYRIIAIILSLSLFPSLAFAIEGGNTVPTTPNAPIETNVDFPSPFGNATITDVLNRLISYGISIAASLAAIMILYGAFQIMSSRGDTKKMIAGRQTIIYALSGLIIIILARGLVSLFEGLVTGLGA